MSDSPERKYVFAMRIGADTLDDLIRIIQETVYEIDRHDGGEYCVVSGGYNTGHVAVLKINPSQTHDGYIDAINEWLERERKHEQT